MAVTTDNGPSNIFLGYLEVSNRRTIAVRIGARDAMDAFELKLVQKGFTQVPASAPQPLLSSKQYRRREALERLVEGGKPYVVVTWCDEE